MAMELQDHNGSVHYVYHSEVPANVTQAPQPAQQCVLARKFDLFASICDCLFITLGGNGISLVASAVNPADQVTSSSG